MTGALSPEQAEQVEDLNSTQIEHLRRLAQTDLFFLAKTVLGYTQVDAGAHAALCNFIVEEPSDRRMVLMPRGFLKSTICTISDSVRLAISNPNEARILIANEVEENAIGFLKEIKAHFTNDGLLPMLFPELVPERLAGPGADWSQTSASVARNAVFKESTWSAMGVGGTAVSKHFDRIKCDDIVGRRAKSSAADMLSTTNWTKDLPALLDRLDCTLDFYGTRKDITDTYSELMTRWPSLATFIREPMQDGETIFPKISTASLLRIMVETPEEWAHDYMNNPVGKGGVDWSTGLIRYFTLGDEAQRVLRFEDSVTGKPKSWKLHELDIIITADPNSGKPLAPDKAAIVVHGISPDEEIFVLSSRSNRWSPDEFVNAIWDDCNKWHPRCVGIEDAGQQNTIYYFEKKCSAERVFFRIEPLKHKNIDKERRIRTALDSPLKTRRLYLLRSQTALIGQIQFHPQLAIHNWDEIDALAHGPQLYRPGLTAKDQQEEDEAEERVLVLRGVTGYGDSISRRTSPEPQEPWF